MLFALSRCLFALLNSLLQDSRVCLSFSCCCYQQPVAHTDVCQDSDAPQAFSCLLLNIPDVDSADAGDAQMCSEYVRDIYAYLQQLEVKRPRRDQVFPCSYNELGLKIE